MPITNCHTHTFTGDHVPPLLAKTFIPEPFHLLLRLNWIVCFFRWWYKGPATIAYTIWFKKWIRTNTRIRSLIRQTYPVNIVAGYYIVFFAVLTFNDLLLANGLTEPTGFAGWLENAHQRLRPAFPKIEHEWIKVIVVVFVFAYFKSVRNILLFVGGLLWKALRSLPGRQTKEMLQRYLNIGRYAFHKKQRTILSKLKAQYPAGTRFIILPMDMEYMEAGTSPIRYRDQMEDLLSIKQADSKGLIHPFVFADPRRMVSIEEEKRSKTGDKPYFEWSLGPDNNVVLEDSFMRDYLEVHKFSGIKIYPALGYYPFDVKLLPLWKYCEQHGIPIMTHCIRGTIFYRGLKKQDWDEHPIFCQAMEVKKNENGSDGYEDEKILEQKGSCSKYEPLVLGQNENVDFSYNFTHPLNYLCLLEEELLRKVLTKALNDKKIDRKEELKKLFGYTTTDKPLTNCLNRLKICFGHFGGEDEWKRYFEKDRYNYSNQLTRYAKGIQFLKNVKGENAPGKLEQLWKWTDWYSIICSMMLQHPCIYADISYILHGNAEILPLLKQTLQHQDLRKKVLYGTDFFVVRNHKSDKNMLADMMGGLDTDDFDQIARVNPEIFLERKYLLSIQAQS